MKTFFISISILLTLIICLIMLSAYLLETKYSNLSFLAQGTTGSPVEMTTFFGKEEKDEEFELTYGWKDFTKKTFYITFRISKEELSAAEEEFGFYPDKMDNYLKKNSDRMMIEMIQQLKNTAQEIIAKSIFAEYIDIEEVNPKVFNISLSVPPAHEKNVRKEFKKITNKIFKERDRMLKKIDKDLDNKKKHYLEERGLRYTENRIEINYEFCTRKNAPRLEKVFELFRRIHKNKNLYELVSLMTAFVQEIKYKKPPLKENDKFILEFWVPPRVLVNNMGDCDSKAVTFASMWTHIKNFPLIIIRIKNHVFLGVALPSPERNHITINGLKYTFLETAGPQKFPVGLISRYSQINLETGHFSYELIGSVK